MQADKEEQEHQVTKDFWKIEQHSKEFCETKNNVGRMDTRQARVIFRRGIHVAKNYKAVGTKYSRNNNEYIEVSRNNKSNQVLM